MTYTTHRQSGFTLLEALIALVVISIGVLGLAGLQAQGMRFNHDAFVRTQATILAGDIMDRMRMQAYKIINGPQLAAALQQYQNVAAAVPANCNAAVASIPNDLDCWVRDVQNALPGQILPGIAQSQGAGTAADPTDDFYTVTLQWTDRSAPGAANITQTWEFKP